MVVLYRVDQPDALLAQLNLVAPCEWSVELAPWNARVVKPFDKKLLEISLHGAVQTAPFFKRLWHEAKLVLVLVLRFALRGTP